MSEKKIGRKETLDALRGVVEKFGPDTTYSDVFRDATGEEYGWDGCRYATDDGKPLCIVGQALAVLGLPFPEGNPNGGVVTYLENYYPDRFTLQAFHVLGRAQYVQDQGGQWGDALRAAEEECA